MKLAASNVDLRGDGLEVGVEGSVVAGGAVVVGGVAVVALALVGVTLGVVVLVVVLAVVGEMVVLLASGVGVGRTEQFAG